jgi:predicted O-methyltransferase YrrM
MELDQYIEQHTSPAGELLEALQRETYLKVLQPHMISGKTQGRLLAMIAKIIQPKYILEIGTFTAYSTLCLAEGLRPDGKLHTIEVNDELQEMITRYIRQAKREAQITLHIGQALEVIPTLDCTFDLAFIDADKLAYPQYYELVLAKMRQGGSILIDNVLWKGKVLDLPANKDKKTQALHVFNEMVTQDSRVENVLLPLRDGLMWVMKK